MAKTLLLADDSVTIQKVVGISFAGEDIDLITVDNGDDAITKAREARPDVILTDIVMPGKNGYEVCEAVKSDPALAHIPVLLLTGTFEAFDEERASRAGAAGHVAKPFEAQTLVARVNELLAGATPAPAPAPASTVVGQTPLETRMMPATPSEPDPNDQSFDFFEDELAPPAPPAAAQSEAAPVDLDPADSAFAFGDDAFDAPPAAGDRTVAMIPEEPAAPVAPPVAPMPEAMPAVPPPAPAAAAPPAPAAAPPPAPAAAPPPAPAAAPPPAPAAAPPPTPAAAPPPAPATAAPRPAAPLAPSVDDLLPPPGAAGDAFDFENDTSFGEGDLLAPLSDEELAQETILDPKGASGYDVSSSDLRESMPAAVAPPELPPAPAASDATVMVSPESTPDPSFVGADLFADELAPAAAAPGERGRETVLASPEPMAPALDDASLEAMVPAAPPAAEPFSAPEPLAAVMPEPPPAAETHPRPEPTPEPPSMPSPMPMPAPDSGMETDPFRTLEPTREPEPAPVAPPQVLAAPEPMASLEPAPESLLPHAPEQPEALLHDVSGHDSAALAGVALAEIEPRLREQLHDTLEKIAWESFGDVAEQIIRQALERVERVAWEVIPQMAETMIREEIRKLKGEG